MGPLMRKMIPPAAAPMASPRSRKVFPCFWARGTLPSPSVLPMIKQLEKEMPVIKMVLMRCTTRVMALAETNWDPMCPMMMASTFSPTPSRPSLSMTGTLMRRNSPTISRQGENRSLTR